jgi:hypothetical protein
MASNVTSFKAMAYCGPSTALRRTLPLVSAK